MSNKTAVIEGLSLEERVVKASSRVTEVESLIRDKNYMAAYNMIKEIMYLGKDPLIKGVGRREEIVERLKKAVRRLHKESPASLKGRYASSKLLCDNIDQISGTRVIKIGSTLPNIRRTVLNVLLEYGITRDGIATSLGRPFFSEDKGIELYLKKTAGESYSIALPDDCACNLFKDQDKRDFAKLYVQEFIKRTFRKFMPTSNGRYRDSSSLVITVNRKNFSHFKTAFSEYVRGMKDLNNVTAPGQGRRNVEQKYAAVCKALGLNR